MSEWGLGLSTEDCGCGIIRGIRVIRVIRVI